jgi:osmotically-inducible protein OsmY
MRRTAGRIGEAGAETAGRVVLDPGITADVKSRLLADSTVKNLKIDVETKDPVVTLSGTVETQTQKDHARSRAQRRQRRPRRKQADRAQPVPLSSAIDL